MIKFYRGNWADLSGIAMNSDTKIKNNAVCFIEDRQVLMMGGQEYGKDNGGLRLAEGAVSGTLVHNGAVNVAAGTLCAFQGDQSMFKYDTAGGTTWTRIFDPTLSSADFISQVSGGTGGVTVYTDRANASGDSYQATAKDVVVAADNIEAKVSAAYTGATAATSVTSGTNTVVVSKPAGIERTEFVLNQDRGIIALSATSGNGAAVAPATQASAILVTEKTLAEQTTDILANGLEIRKLVSGDTGYDAGYRSQYALYNKQTGLQLGTQINLVKDQFLKKAQYVIGYTNNGQWYEYRTPKSGEDFTEGWYEVAADGITYTVYQGSALPTKDNANRYLKLIFAVSASGQTPGQFPEDSAEYTATETDNVVYLDVNELFDSYTGVSGVTVNAASNEISAQINASSNESGTGAGTHFSGAFLKNSAGGLYVEGIKQEITGYIQDIAGITAQGVASNNATAATYYNNASYPVFLTEVGIGTDGTLTGTASGINAEGVYFNGTTNASINAGSVGAAISAIGLTIENMDYSYDGASGNGDPEFVVKVAQDNGKVSVTGQAINSNILKATSFQTAKLSGTTGANSTLHNAEKTAIYIGSAEGTAQVSLQAALTSLATSVHDAISAMDLDRVGVVAGDTTQGGGTSKTAPAGNASTAEAYQVINTIKQSDGHVYATTVSMEASNTYISAIAAATGNGADARVAVPAYNVQDAIASISNTIAKLDYAGHEEGSAPTSGGTTKFTITKEVTQTDGLISETTVDLTAANTFVDAINGNLGYLGDNNAPVNANLARVAILADDTTPEKLAGTGKNGSVQMALNNISNILADYLSFHDKDGKVI